MRRLAGIIALAVAAVLCFAACGASPMTLTDGNFRIVVAPDEAAPVRLAVERLCDDFEKVSGSRPEVSDTLGTEPEMIEIVVVDAAADRPIVDPESLKPLDSFESHRVYADPQSRRIYLYGKDMRGTIYAIYSFSEEILGVPPLWYFASWQPERQEKISVPAAYDYFQPSPEVRYRAWFPNDQDLFVPWRALSEDNNERWLETMLRLKLNTVEMETTVTYPDWGMTDNALLLKKYGLVLTAHHHTALNNSLHNWDGYWREVRGTEPPKLSVKRLDDLKAFWRYNIETVHRSGMECLWLISFRGKGDQPFWAAFDDAPAEDSERGKVISRMLRVQLDLIREITGEDKPHVRTTFYDELSDLLSGGYLDPPVGDNILWTYVAARRDHYPNADIVTFDASRTPVRLGYYMNLQFTSTGAHLAPAEGPWKMEFNYRYVRSKAPLEFSVVNAGNIREFVLSLSANARMMWDFDSYSTDSWLRDYCEQHFGRKHAEEIARLYRDYFCAYWQQKSSDFPGMERQYIFQDLRHAQAFKQILSRFERKFTPNPLRDIGFERVKGRTFRLEGDNQVDTLIRGMSLTAPRFAQVADRCEKMMGRLPEEKRAFFRDNLYAPCRYMEYLSRSLLDFVTAYRQKGAGETYRESLERSAEYLERAREVLRSTQEGVFSNWYDSETIFGFAQKLERLQSLIASAPVPGVSASSFGKLSTGEATTLYTVTNGAGASMQLLDYGARVVSIKVPDRTGQMGDVVVGYGDLPSFEGGDRFIGPVIGRYANRINHSAIELDGQRYELAANETLSGEKVQCHGGPEGFDRFVWKSCPVADAGRSGVKFSRLSPDGEQGYTPIE